MGWQNQTWQFQFVPYIGICETSILQIHQHPIYNGNFHILPDSANSNLNSPTTSIITTSEREKPEFWNCHWRCSWKCAYNDKFGKLTKGHLAVCWKDGQYSENLTFSASLTLPRHAINVMKYFIFRRHDISGYLETKRRAKLVIWDMDDIPSWDGVGYSLKSLIVAIFVKLDNIC